MSQTVTENAKVQSAPDYSQYDYSRLTPYVHPPETTADLPWAELVTLDLEDYGRPGKSCHQRISLVSVNNLVIEVSAGP